MKKKMSMLIAGIAFMGVMAMNVQSSLNENNSTGLNLNMLANTAHADGEGGGYSCSVSTICSDGGKVACTGEIACSRWAGYSVTCDDNTTYC